jgi:hypothetical protein
MKRSRIIENLLGSNNCMISVKQIEEEEELRSLITVADEGL